MRNIPDEILLAAAPASIWEAAIKQAERSSHKRFRTGAVIYYGMGRHADVTIYSQGTSHFHNGGENIRSIHAELHAIRQLPRSYGGAKCIVVTLTKSGNFAQNSRPCHDCAMRLNKHVWSVLYPERCNDGNWVVQSCSMHDLMRAGLRSARRGAFAASLQS